MRAKMSRLQRAKQFMPFSALKGFAERLAAVARCREERRELSEDQLQALDRRFRALTAGAEVQIVYFNDGGYIEVRGSIDKIDNVRRVLCVNGRTIGFDLIRTMETE